MYGRALSNTAGTAKWTEGDPFAGVQSGNYWSSTSLSVNPDGVWLVDFYYGNVGSDYKTSGVGDVWPVRGGQ